ncbi:MAG: hypothetical protein AMJ88_13540 [Anaerolineae bacterium SM23_ 63]|nr:MAG: hypothetical protein AMJ88_13540 [Anaerolineae bacterium SM23_ 63]
MKKQKSEPTTPPTVQPNESTIESTIEYLKRAYDAGCPREQIELFWRGSYCAQPKQLLFHAAARLCDQPNGPTEVGFGGARGGAKSHALLAQLMLDDCMRVSNLKVLMLRKVGKAVRESFEDLRGRVLMHTPHTYLRSSGVVKLPNGSRMVLGHFKNETDIDAYLGLAYDVIGVEEATTLTYGKYKDVRTCCRSSRPDWRARTYSNTNPGGIGHQWYKARFINPARNGSQTNTRFIFSTVEDNAYLDEEYRKNLEDLTGWKKRAWRFGDWDIAAGQFFTNFRENIHVIDPFPIDEGSKYWVSMDYGYSLAHWNIAYLIGEDRGGNLYVMDELAHRKTLVPTIAEDLRSMLYKWGVTEEHLWKFIIGSDAFARKGVSGQSITDKWREEGFSPEQAQTDRINGAAELLIRLGDQESGIAPSIRIFRNCTRLIECLPALEHNPNRPEDVLKVRADDEGRGGDDPYDALRYGLMVVRIGSGLEVGISPVANWRG